MKKALSLLIAIVLLFCSSTLAQGTYDLGDVTGDGNINSRDISALQKYVTGITKFSENEMGAADINSDGKINSRDISALQKHVIGIELITGSTASYYALAQSQINSGDYTSAYYNLKKCGDYKPANLLLKKFKVEYEYYEWLGYEPGHSEMTEDKYTCKYDKYGNEIYCKDEVNDMEYDSQYTVIYERSYVYDEHDNITQKTSYSDGKKSYEYRYKYEYDKHGNIKNEYWCDENGKVLSRTSYAYDEKNNVISSVSYDANGYIDGKEEYRYDNDGNMTYQLILDYVDYKPEGFDKFEYEYAYDENGKHILTTYRATEEMGSTPLYYKRVYEYDKNGNMTCSLYYEKDDELFSITEYEYDENGIMTSHVAYDTYGLLSRGIYEKPMIFYTPNAVQN